MHPIRLKSFRRDFKRENTASCIINRQYSQLLIGSPAMVESSSFRAVDKIPRAYGAYSFEDDRIFKGKQKGVGKSKMITISDILEEYPADNDLNEALRRSLAHLNLLTVFPQWPDSTDVYSVGANTGDLYVTHKTPIMWDESGSYVNVKNLADQFSADDLKHFPDFINGKLRDHRYIVYTIKGLTSEVKARKTVENFTVIMNKLHKLFGLSFSYLMGDRPHSPFNEMSMHFYRLSDVMPIFDIKAAKSSFAMDFVVTNSEIDTHDIYAGYNYMSVKSIFSYQKENIITIDGDNINRKCSHKPSDTMSPLLHMLVRYCGKSISKKDKPIDVRKLSNAQKLKISHEYKAYVEVGDDLEL